MEYSVLRTAGESWVPEIRASGYYGGWLAEADADITLIKQAAAGFRDAATLPIQGGVGELIDHCFMSQTQSYT